jgi:hypothetical protein
MPNWSPGDHMSKRNYIRMTGLGLTAAYFTCIAFAALS